MNKVFGLILASGTGERSGLNKPKQFFKVKGKMLIEHSIQAFEENALISDIVVVSHPDFLDFVKEIVKKNKYKKVVSVIKGGKTRQESSYNGVFAIPDNSKVLIHDAVRPFISQKIINDCVYALDKYQAVGVAVPCSDTIIEIDENKIVKNIPNRTKLMQIQTPQAFQTNIIKKAHNLLKERKDIQVTDDCGLIKNLDLCDIYIVEGDVKNVKITYPKDVVLAEKIYEIE